MHPLPRLLLALFLTANVCTAAAAQFDFGATQSYFASSPDVPPLAQEYLRAHANEGMRIVTFGGVPSEDRQIFYSLSPPSRSAAGMCRFAATQIFPHRSLSGAVSWDSKPPKPSDYVQSYQMIAPANPVCPRQDDKSYVAIAGGVTDDEFNEVLEFWRAISGAAETFDMVSALLPFILSQDVAMHFDDFRSSVLAPSQDKAQLKAVTRRRSDGYELTFGPPIDAPGNDIVGISRAGNRFQMLEYSFRQY